MKYLFIDTETTGLFNFKLPADAPGQPRLAHLAMVRCDEAGEVEASGDFYVEPDGWTMPAEAERINGLSTAFLRSRGIPVRDVLGAYAEAIRDEGRCVVAYNAQYDLKIMRGEFRRAGLPDHFEITKNICVMRPMTDLCRLPGRFGFKFPKLVEALEHLGHRLENAHNAIADVEGARLVFLALKARGLLPEPAVHYAKDKAGAF